MKEEKGITLTSLVLYVIVMTMALGVMSSIITNFYNNTDAVQGNVQEIVEFNKFNNYFLKEVKLYNNKVDYITNDYIVFASGNSFSLNKNKIYYNNLEICDGVMSMQMKQGKDGNEIDKSIVYVIIEFKNFKKSMNYKIENIY